MSKAMTDYLTQKAKADAEQEEARRLYVKARNEVLSDIKSKIKEFGFNKRELGLPARESKLILDQPDIQPRKAKKIKSPDGTMSA